jgi:hypothetical protein
VCRDIETACLAGGPVAHVLDRFRVAGERAWPELEKLSGIYRRAS